MKRHLRLIVVALISAFSLGAGATLAQQGQQQMPMMGYGMGQNMMGHTGMGMMGGRDARDDGTGHDDGLRSGDRGTACLHEG